MTSASSSRGTGIRSVFGTGKTTGNHTLALDLQFVDMIIASKD